MSKDKKHLYYLDELSDYKIASDDPDVRGWEVKDADNRVIGKVDNLLVSKNKEKVLYLDVEVDESIIEANHDPFGSGNEEGVHEFLNKEGEEHVIIPIGLASLNENKKYVYTDSINYQTFAETKRIQKGSDINRNYERNVIASYNRRPSTKEALEQDQKFQDTDQDQKLHDDVEMQRKYEEKNPQKHPISSYDSTNEERIPEDDTFYERDEFDRRNYRKK